MSTARKILLIGNRGGTNVGGCFEAGARAVGLETCFVEMKRAFEAPVLLRRFNWILREKRPTWMGRFNAETLKACHAYRPEHVLATGLVPLEARTLRTLGDAGIATANYLTDDPWNPAHKASWFLEGLPLYRKVFSVRQSNLDDLRRLGCRAEYLPFAYSPDLHYHEDGSSDEARRVASDVVFAGGADADRVPYITALAARGIRVGLYGGYWERYAETRALSRGQADPRTVRLAISNAKIALCLVRRANRDGHSMRSFEVPAIGACMLVENTDEHRRIFGEEGRAALYFTSVSQMVEKADVLLKNAALRDRLAKTAHALITGAPNTYADRLRAIVASLGG